MRKIKALFVTTIKEYSAYRLNFILWRLRMFLNLLFTFFLWNSVYMSTRRFANYDKTTMLSYILYSTLIATFVMGSRTSEVANQINDGSIMNTLLKPISLFGIYLSRDFADKCMNILFALVEFSFVVVLFHVPLIMPHNILFFLLFFLNSLFLSFFINMLLSFIAFWTSEVWASRFIFMVIVLFLSGSYFPLDLLPRPFFYLFLATPFPYLFYLPAKLLITKMEFFYIYTYIISCVWVAFLYIVTNNAWKQGIKHFSFWGK